MTLNGMLSKAREFAIKAHGKQKYGEQPYIVHLEAVVANLSSYGETAQVIGYLHDVIEDTDVTYEKVKQVFGPFVADCVAIVTDELGTNRKERKTKTYEKMSKVSGELELALLVKAADRLANVRACLAGGKPHLINVYKCEHSVFKNAAYREGQCDEIWQEIDMRINS